LRQLRERCSLKASKTDTDGSSSFQHLGLWSFNAKSDRLTGRSAPLCSALHRTLRVAKTLTLAIVLPNLLRPQLSKAELL